MARRIKSYGINWGGTMAIGTLVDGVRVAAIKEETIDGGVLLLTTYDEKQNKLSSWRGLGALVIYEEIPEPDKKIKL